ncbi:MAG: hypothetical protein IPG45_33365 [Deltaproteobacteria bacterium]|jgi:hypothetical protein|nr:hypothetical protein [Deltaproteobacteria bacterium]
MGNPRAFGPPALLLFFTWGLFLVGCGGDANEGLGELPPTLDAIQQHVFTPGCATSACHDRVTRGGDLDLSNAQVSYDQMVNVGSKNPVAKANGWLIVKPEDPARSFLVRKLVGPGVGEGEAMPSVSQELDPYYQKLIETWIQEGARR